MTSHHGDNPPYFIEVIPDPVTAVIFRDKVVIVRANGEVIERELADDPGLPPEDEHKIESGKQYFDRMAKHRGEGDPGLPNLGGYQPGPARKIGPTIIREPEDGNYP
jgi:hypothetical protein